MFTSYLSSKSLGFTLCHVFGLSPKLSRKIFICLAHDNFSICFYLSWILLAMLSWLGSFRHWYDFRPYLVAKFSAPEASTPDASSRLFLQMSLIALQVGQQNAPQKRPSGPSFFGEVFLLGFYIRSPSLGSRFFGKKSNFSRDSVLFC